MASPSDDKAIPEAYVYDPLPSKHHIRYLILEPGQGEAPLQCSLHASRLDSMPYFEAISYVWGSSDRYIPITCDGQTLYITRNLRDVLRQVRQPQETRALWADSICINQEDNAEKGVTVAMMGQLYSRADRVLICLGVNDIAESPGQVAALVAEVDGMIQRELEAITGTWNTFPPLDDDDPICEDERWMTFRELIEEPWFDRGWTVQEAGLAKDARILWSEVEINWASILRVNHWLRYRGEPLRSRWHLYNVSMLHKEPYLRRYRREAMTMVEEGGLEDEAAGSPPFLETLDLARSLSLTDARDRVYAFLEFAGASAYARDIEPNYEQSVEDVHFDLASRYTKSVGDASILHYVQQDEHTIREKLASWVPRWNISIYHTGLTYSSTSRLIRSPSNSEQPPVITPEGNLQVRAAIIDTVRYASDKLHWVKTSISDVISIWATISNMSATASFAYDAPLEVFARLLSADKAWTTYGVPHTSAYLLRLHEGTTPGGFGDLAPAELDRLKSSAEEGDLRLYHTAVRERGHNRRVIMTQRGFYGLAPESVEEGDLCGLIFGETQTPFILRPSDQPGYYKVLGNCYIPGPLKYTNSGDLMVLGSSGNHCWVEWGVKEQEITLC